MVTRTSYALNFKENSSSTQVFPSIFVPFFTVNLIKQPKKKKKSQLESSVQFSRSVVSDSL